MHVKAEHKVYNTFLISHIHGPFRMPAEVIDSRDDTLRVSFDCLLLNCSQKTLGIRGRMRVCVRRTRPEETSDINTGERCFFKEAMISSSSITFLH